MIGVIIYVSLVVAAIFIGLISNGGTPAKNIMDLY